MREPTYSQTVCKCKTKAGQEITLQAGQGVRLFDGLFGDAIILGFKQTEYGVWVKVARPHADATCIGTTGPGACVSLEVFEISLENLLESPEQIHPVSQGIRVVCKADNPVDRPYEDEKLDVTGGKV